MNMATSGSNAGIPKSLSQLQQLIAASHIVQNIQGGRLVLHPSHSFPRNNASTAVLTGDSMAERPSPPVNTLIPSFSYKVKIINPTKKTDVMIREFHSFTSKFESVSLL